MTEVSAWVALDDADVGNGCMSMVPGSHKWGDRIALLHTFPDFTSLPDKLENHVVEAVARPVKAGHVHYHHALTWHGSPANTSGRPRRAIAVHFMTDQTRFVASGRHVMKQFVTAGDGEPLAGDAFPLVYPAAAVQPA
jgi:ectoine hydroxylase-related dioxygenase (phytanoyl-CoA dioxygenase family)